MENNFDWTDRSLAIRMRIGQDGSQYDECIVPLFENLDKEGIYEYDYPDINDAFNKLKLKWYAQKWGYYGHASDMETDQNTASQLGGRKRFRI